MPNDGGPAFPIQEYERVGDASGVTVEHPGMSLRDWFAGQALVALFQMEAAVLGKTGKVTLQNYGAQPAAGAYELADAMLVARAQAVADDKKRESRLDLLRGKNDA